MARSKFGAASEYCPNERPLANVGQCHRIQIGRLSENGRWARIRRDLKHITDIDHLKWRWSLRMTKPRYGIETIRDFVIDEQYGGRCGGTYHSRWNDRGYRGTSSTHHYYLRNAFLDHNVRIDEADVLVDVGCGKGRVLNYWLHRGLRNHMVGIEIDERWAEFAARRLARFPNVDILCGDAFDLILPRWDDLFHLQPIQP